MRTNYDLIVIGSGPAGRRAAIQAAKVGRRVLIVEQGRRVGGVSVHTGTIPSKSLRETVLNLTGWRERGFYGQAYRAKQLITAADLQKRLHLTLDHEVEVLEHQFVRNHVETVHGHACFICPHEILVHGAKVGKQQFKADRFVVAVGTTPHRPKTIPFDGRTVLDSDEILNIEKLPRSMTIVGAGVIGIEYATIFNALDIHITLIDNQRKILPFVDREIVDAFVHDLRERGVSLRLGCSIKSVEVADNGCWTELGGDRRVQSEMLLYSAGRTGATTGLGLEAAGLRADSRGRLSAHPETFQTSVPHIYAAGDVIGFPSLASTSAEQGRIAACHALGLPAHEPPKHHPYGIYSVPEMSTCGLTEEDVQARSIPYEVGIARLRETARGHIMGLRVGMMKLLFSLKTRRLLGVHIVGEGATELIHIGQAVLNLRGTLEYFIENSFNFPTLAEAYKIAALDAFNRMPQCTKSKGPQSCTAHDDGQASLAFDTCATSLVPDGVWQEQVALEPTMARV